MIKHSFLILILSLILPTTCLAGIDSFTVKAVAPDQYDRMMGSEIWRFYLDGPIDGNSPKILLEEIEKTQAKTISFYLNSPGGSLISGIELGRIIRKFGMSTNVGIFKEDQLQTVHGECHSACSLAYLGGFYRYMEPEDVYGVHRFSKDSSSEADLDLGQIMSAAVTNYIVEMGVSPALFEKMVEAGPSEIKILNLEELKDLNVVNSGRAAATWTIEATPDFNYLKGAQVTVFGEGKLVFFCQPDGLILQAVYEAGPNAEDIVETSNHFAIELASKTYELPAPERFFNNDGWVNSVHKFPKELISVLKDKKDIGFIMQLQKGAPMFRGFRVDMKDASDNSKVVNFLSQCKT